MSPEQIDMIVELLPHANSLVDISKVVGADRKRVRQAAMPFIELMRISGAIPPCECGQPRYHRSGCTASRARQRTHLTPTEAYRQEKRRIIVELLAEGRDYATIGERIGLNPMTIKDYLRFLTPEQWEQRDKIVIARNPRNLALSNTKRRLFSQHTRGFHA